MGGGMTEPPPIGCLLEAEEGAGDDSEGKELV